MKIIIFLKSIFVEKKYNKKYINILIRAFNISLLLIIFYFVFYISFKKQNFVFNWEAIFKYRAKFFIGIKNTILISFISLILSIFIGFIFAIAQESKVYIIKYFAKFYVTIIRGTPFLVQILIFFYIIADAINLKDRYLSGIIILSIFSGAYITEIIRGGILSISKAQQEAMNAIGFTKFQKYFYIIIPQIIKIILPGLIGQLASLIKDSSLLSIISISEFTLNAQEVNSFTFSTFEAYIPLAIGYFILTGIVNIFGKWIEKKFLFEH